MRSREPRFWDEPRTSQALNVHVEAAQWPATFRGSCETLFDTLNGARFNVGGLGELLLCPRRPPAFLNLLTVPEFLLILSSY